MASHTATGEWKSFEVRMRRRRAERLALRAEAAVDAGFFDDARNALHEARRLAPDLPLLAQIEQSIEIRQQSRAGRRFLQPRDVSLYVAVALVVLAAIVGYAWTAHRAAAAQTADEHVASAPQPAGLNAPAGASAEPRPVVVERQPITVPETLLKRPSAADVEAEQITKPSFDALTPLPALTPRVQHVAETPAVPISTLSSLPAADVAPSSSRVVAPSVEDVPVAALPSATAAAATETAPRDDVLVHRTLQQYATAYSRLDAEAAQQVWPSVNRDALERAFDELSLQEVSLGNCDIDVQGQAARAACAGTETWAPKIGDRQARTQARNWTFELMKGGAGWQIVSARVQNK